MDKLWWNSITKARRFIEDVVEAAVQEKSIVLALPENVPWRNTLMQIIEDELKQANPEKSFDMINCPEDEVGKFLLDKYCKKEKKATYRLTTTYAAFLGKSEDIVLNDRYVWVENIPEKKYSEWINFINDYNKNLGSKSPAIFILETSDENIVNSTKKGISKIVFDQKIDTYDKFTFCALISSDNKCSEILRPYLVELVSAVCNEDIELCAECIREGSKFLSDPVGTINDIRSVSFRSDGREFIFSKTLEEVNILIWETQLKHIFPAIERYRNNFIRRFRYMIEPKLPLNNPYGEPYQKPEEVEIGTLLYLVNSSEIYLKTKELDMLARFRDARNTIAHLGILELPEMEFLLKNAY